MDPPGDTPPTRGRAPPEPAGSLPMTGKFDPSWRGTPPVTYGRNLMPTIFDAANATDTEDAFELDVQVTTEAAVGYTVRGCDTSDGCGSTCASACASN